MAILSISITGFMLFIHIFVAGTKKINKTSSMAESSNTESVHENVEKQSLEYGNGYNMTSCFFVCGKENMRNVVFLVARVLTMAICVNPPIDVVLRQIMGFSSFPSCVLHCL